MWWRCIYFIFSNCKLYIYGPDLCGRFAHLESLVEEKNIGDLVSLNLGVSGKEKENILLDTDIFIQTSRFEGMPMGLLECLSYGIPCIVTYGTTLGEFVDANNAGWSCDTTADAIAQTIKKAVSERNLWQEKSVCARDSVNDNFNWDIITLNTVTYYQKEV